MSNERSIVKHVSESDVVETVVVAVKASREIPKTALVWALTHVAQPGHCITLIVVIPSLISGRKLLGRITGDCASRYWRSYLGKNDVTDLCSQMILQLHNMYDPNKINVKIKTVSGSPSGAVAAEAKQIKATWVVLDKKLKHEQKRCMEELQCNIVTMKKSRPKIIRLNLIGSPKKGPEMDHQLPPKPNQLSVFSAKGLVSPISSPEALTATEPGTSSVSSSDPATSPFFIPLTSGPTKQESLARNENRYLIESDSDSESEHLSSSFSSLRFQSSRHWEDSFQGYSSQNQTPKCEEYRGDVRDAISLSRNTPSGPPPLCSLCQHKAPIFGKPPRWFTYAELEVATSGFSQDNFLAEGGFGSVYRGVLPDGQAVAVKQHKLASSQGDQEFCSEVEVLSCAQHRNVVMLIGFCMQDRRRLLVYEYVCNGSLDSHLYGRDQDPLQWSARQKIALGAARGLRYLHEECRVGCIVHRDMRPNNILITHDFQPLVGDFGLARWQPDGDTEEETKVIGTFGYLAPEYAQSGQITEKADVYSFGVVLVELITGRKAVDLKRPKGQQCLAEWARPLLEHGTINELLDPRLGNYYSAHEVYCMMQAASLCIKRDPHLRPRMSQVLRMLEGDMMKESRHMLTPGYDVGNQSGRLLIDQQRYIAGQRNETLKGLSGKLSLSSTIDRYLESDRSRRSNELYRY
ncbi:inactive protein kinase SELMODRAFT_444075-like [Rutidosis leptorrhynchoides]|uniref:inactive protein kinase SELMODRAFT_444075-like n=1 Tax=Rutidosis leptorrhynchoides TaxID=125765 RepID=UPI003A99C2CB